MKNKENETILVTGATGNVGTEVVKQLSRANPSASIRLPFILKRT